MPRKRKERAKRVNGEGSVYPVKNRAGEVIGYRGQVSLGHRVDGKPDRRTVRANTEREVVELMRVMQADSSRGMLAGDDTLTLEQFSRAWLEHKKEGLRAISHVAYEACIRLHILPTLGKVRLAKLTAQNLDVLYRAKLSEGLSSNTVRSIHKQVFTMLRQAVKWQLVPRNVAEAASPPQYTKSITRVFTIEQVVTLLDHAQGERLHALFYLAVFTGMRREELLGLRWQDIDLERRVLRVRQTLVQLTGGLRLNEYTKTDSGRRDIALSEDTTAVLLSHLERQNAEKTALGDGWEDNGLVFPSRVGSPIWPFNLFRVYRDLLERAGLEHLNFHALRHTSASLAIRRGDNPKVVSERLGHADVSFTLNTYVKTFADQHQEAALGMADLAPRMGGVKH